jgi:CHASE3 domain sensor protein
MAKDRSLVRASDIGAWAYCRRAWYLAHVRGMAHARPELLQRGNAAHAQHGQQVRRAATAQRVGLWLIVAGALLALLAGLFIWVTP